MEISVYLHNDIIDTLKMYGDLDDVINLILDAASEGKLEIENKPVCREREGARRLNVNITNQDYLQLLETYGNRSNTISLRRLLYWFVENEIYNDLEWEPLRDYVDFNENKRRKQIDKCVNSLQKLMYLVSKSETDTITHCIDLLQSLR